MEYDELMQEDISLLRDVMCRCNDLYCRETGVPVTSREENWALPKEAIASWLHNLCHVGWGIPEKQDQTWEIRFSSLQELHMKLTIAGA